MSGEPIYAGIPSIMGKNYTHHTVNHFQNFIDPISRWHTLDIGVSAKKNEKNLTMHLQLFDTYLPELMWRKRFDGLHQNAFNNIIKHMVEQYGAKCGQKFFPVFCTSKNRIDTKYRSIIIEKKLQNYSTQKNRSIKLVNAKNRSIIQKKKRRKWIGYIYE